MNGRAGFPTGRLWPTSTPALIILLRLAAAVGLVLFGLCALLLPHMLTYALGLLLLMALGVGAFLFPWVTAGIAIFSLVVSFEWFRGPTLWVAERFGDIEVTSLQKLVILVMLGPAILRAGIRAPLNPAIAALLIMLGLSLTVSTTYPGLTAFQSVKTLFGLGMPFILFNLNYPYRVLERFLLMVALFPIISLIVGYGAELQGFYSIDLKPWAIARVEYTGAVRFMGANIPAGLAYLSLISVVICLYQAFTRGKRKYLWLAGISMVILILTGTRTPAACALVFAALTTLLMSGRSITLSDRLVVYVLGSLVVSLVLVFYWPDIQQRFTYGAMSDSMNVSGREVIWDAAIAAISVDPIFGRGLGTGAIFLLDNTNSQIVQARAAHNEYLRLLLDGGLTGLLLYLGGFVWLMSRECKGLNRDQKRYFGLFFLVFAIYSLTDNTISSLQTIALFFALALMMALGRRESRR